MSRAHRRCERCGYALAADNPGARCSPCGAAVRRSEPTSGPALGAGIRSLVAAWEDGFSAFRDAADVDNVTAAELAFRLRLIPPGWTLTVGQLAALADDRNAPATEFARRWGVNRRTVAAWRRGLGLERILVSRPPDIAAPEAVRDIEVRVGETTRLVVQGVRVRLGRSARSLVEQLATHHPAPVADDALRQSVFAGRDAAAAQAALHATVCRLRRHLPEHAIVRDGSGYRLNIPAGSLVRSQSA